MIGIIVLLCLVVGGCSLPTHNLDVVISGKDLRTPWGEVQDGFLEVHSSWGKPNVTNIRSTKSAT